LTALGNDWQDRRDAIKQLASHPDGDDTVAQARSYFNSLGKDIPRDTILRFCDLLEDLGTRGAAGLLLELLNRFKSDVDPGYVIAVRSRKFRVASAWPSPNYPNKNSNAFSGLAHLMHEDKLRALRQITQSALPAPDCWLARPYSFVSKTCGARYSV